MNVILLPAALPFKENPAGTFAARARLALALAVGLRGSAAPARAQAPPPD